MLPAKVAAADGLYALPLPFGLDDPYGLASSSKAETLLPALQALTNWHSVHCPAYGHMRERLFPMECIQTLDALPFLPIRLFKTLELRSVPAEQVIKTLTSSGTTGQTVSRIYLDKETSARQTQALASIVMSFLGKQRLPMVLLDSKDVLQNRTQFNARAAGILGFSVFGRTHFYGLNGDMSPRFEELAVFLESHRSMPTLAFGFTSVIWQCFLQTALRTQKTFDFGPQSILIHGGGWKRLHDQRVDNPTFKHHLRAQFGFGKIFNYYGMVEQVGSIFMECEHGRLHAPAFADIIIRDPLTLTPLKHGQEGVIQVLSILPTSYPGHSLLTEDVGTVHGEDDCPCGRLGRTFSVHGRVPSVEIRGCSDTRALPI